MSPTGDLHESSLCPRGPIYQVIPLGAGPNHDLVRRFEQLVLEKADLERRLAEALARIEELGPREPMPESKGW